MSNRQPRQPIYIPATAEAKPASPTKAATLAAQRERAKSAYSPSWERLKLKGKITATLAVPADYSLAAREAIFLRYRKAISTRKEKDWKFRAEFPTAKIVVVSKDFAEMKFELALTYLAQAITLSDLVDLNTPPLITLD